MKDDEMTKSMLQDFQDTGTASMPLVKRLCSLFDQARGRWEAKYLDKSESTDHIDKVMHWTLLKTMSYILKLNKHGKLSILKNSPPAWQLKWRIVRFAMQMIGYSWRAWQKNKGKEGWLDKRLAKQQAKQTTQWVDNALR